MQWEWVAVELGTHKSDWIFDKLIEFGFINAEDDVKSDVIINDNNNLLSNLSSFRRAKKSTTSWSWLRPKID